MTLEDWLRNSWLQPHTSTPNEIKNLFGVIDQGIADAQLPGLSSDGRLERAYTAGLQAATAALFALGYKVLGQNNHQRVIESIEVTLGPSETKLSDALLKFKKKRHTINYEMAGAVSDGEAEAMVKLAVELRTKVTGWIKKNHPELMP